MLFDIPRDILVYEISKYLVEIDKQILRKVCHLFSSLFSFKSIKFNDKDIILELVHIKRYQKLWTIDTMHKIAKQGDLECIKYLRNPESGKKCNWNSYTTLFAAEGGYIQCLKYLHENGCEWDSYTIAYATSNGHLECVKYALYPDSGKPCKWNWRDLVWVVQNTSTLIFNDACPWDFLSTLFETLDKTRDRLECLKILRYGLEKQGK